ncbi:MAG: acyl-CoA dehydrogenase family protein [Methylocella sp.]
MNRPASVDEIDHSAPIREVDYEALFARIAEGAAERERERILLFEQIEWLRQARFGALRLRREDGGRDASFRELFGLVIRLGAADANVAHILRNHFTVAEQYARRPRTEQERRWQRAVLDGAIVGLGNTELGTPRAGATPPDTTLTPEPGGYRLNGVKYYTTGTLYSDLVLVRAADPSGAVAAVIVPTTRQGVEIIDDWDGAGQRLTASGTTHFRNVRVEQEEAVFDREGIGYALAYANTQPQLFLTAIVAGIVRAIRDDAATLVNSRGRNFYHAPAERPADDPILRQAVGQIAAYAFAAEAAVLAAADAFDVISRTRDAGRDDSELAHAASLAAAQAKVVVDELAIRSGSLIFDVGGASATKRTLNLDRHWRNARTLASHNPDSYKAMAIGAHVISGAPLPDKGFF